jgi:hypothetical protein
VPTLHNHDIATTENYKTCFYVLDSNETDIEKSAQTAIWCRTREASPDKLQRNATMRIRRPPGNADTDQNRN